jgi:hypothetical protein
MGTTVVWLSGHMPNVLLTPEAKDDMDLIIANGGTDEIGWLGFVRKEGPDYLVYRIVLPKQEVHAATTEISPEGIAMVLEELLASGQIQTDEIANLRLWGHSHVHMGVTASGQDDAQMKVFTDSIAPDGPCPFFIRVIGNKKREFNFSIFEFNTGISIIDAPFRTVYATGGDREEYWKGLITDRVSKIYHQKWQRAPAGGNSGYYNGYIPPADRKDGYGYGGYGYGGDYAYNTKTQKIEPMKETPLLPFAGKSGETVTTLSRNDVKKAKKRWRFKGK